MLPKHQKIPLRLTPLIYFSRFFMMHMGLEVIWTWKKKMFWVCPFWPTLDKSVVNFQNMIFHDFQASDFGDTHFHIRNEPKNHLVWVTTLAFWIFTNTLPAHCAECAFKSWFLVVKLKMGCGNSGSKGAWPPKLIWPQLTKPKGSWMGHVRNLN